MTTLTQYWQQLQECVDNLPSFNEDTEYSKQINIAKSMIETGLTIEKVNAFKIQGLVETLYETSQQFKNQVPHPGAKKEDDPIYLPKIVSTPTLIFAMMYYQHLSNYADVSYGGNSYFKDRIVQGVAAKKPRTALQANLMLGEIKDYCTKKGINIDNSQLLRNKEESSKDFIARITKMIPTENKVVEKEQPKTQPNVSKLEVVKSLEQSLQDLTTEKDELTKKLNAFTLKLKEFSDANDNLLRIECEWHSKAPIIRFFYWLISWMYTPSQVKDIAVAEGKLDEAKRVLNKDLPTTNTETYKSNLEKELRDLTARCDLIENEIQRKKIEIEQEQEKQKPVEANTPQNGGSEPAPVVSVTPNTTTAASNLDNVYSFFKENCPSNRTLGAIAVGAAAVIIQNCF